MAKPIVAQPPASSQLLPAELEQYQLQAFEDNTSLPDCFRSRVDSLIEDTQDFLTAVDQAAERGMISVEQNGEIRHRWREACRALSFMCLLESSARGGQDD